MEVARRLAQQIALVAIAHAVPALARVDGFEGSEDLHYEGFYSMICTFSSSSWTISPQNITKLTYLCNRSCSYQFNSLAFN